MDPQEWPPKKIIDVPGLAVLLYKNQFHFDQGKWLRRIDPRIALKFFDEGLELTNLHAEGNREHLLGRITLRALAQVFGQHDPK
jgi:hypothetical protein